MTQERLWQVLDPSWGDLRALSPLLCGSAAAVVLLKWLGKSQVQQKMDEARRSRHLALERMEKAARRLKQEASQILSLTMEELAEKVKDESLSPESVLYSYMDKAYLTEFIAKWRQLRLDVILCPVLGPAFNHGYAGKLFAAASYTNLHKVLDFPAGVVPVSRVTRAEEEELKHYRGHYRDLWDKRLREASRKRAQVLEPAE